MDSYLKKNWIKVRSIIISIRCGCYFDINSNCNKECKKIYIHISNSLHHLVNINVIFSSTPFFSNTHFHHNLTQHTETSCSSKYNQKNQTHPKSEPFFSTAAKFRHIIIRLFLRETRISPSASQLLYTYRIPWKLSSRQKWHDRVSFRVGEQTASNAL